MDTSWRTLNQCWKTVLLKYLPVIWYDTTTWLQSFVSICMFRGYTVDHLNCMHRRSPQLYILQNIREHTKIGIWIGSRQKNRKNISEIIMCLLLYDRITPEWRRSPWVFSSEMLKSSMDGMPKAPSLQIWRNDRRTAQCHLAQCQLYYRLFEKSDSRMRF